MKEQKETVCKSGNELSKALSYARRLLKVRFYHSQTIEAKLKDRFSDSTVSRAMKLLNDQEYFDDKLYIEKVKKVCMKKYYGIKRLRKILYDKGIKYHDYIYTYDEEKIVLDDFMELFSIKYQRLEPEEYDAKLKYQLRYKGFSDYNIRKLIEL